MNDDEAIIAATRRWLDDVVIAHNFCPFARFVREAGSIRYRVCNAPQETVLTVLASECLYLTDNPDTATTLLMLSDPALKDFDAFLDVLDAANGLLQRLDLEGIYQLASFHPDYQFEGSAPTEAGNYTNRSPYPTLHLIREADIERALADYPNPEKIYEDNIATANRLGTAHLASALAALTRREIDQGSGDV